MSPSDHRREAAEPSSGESEDARAGLPADREAALLADARAPTEVAPRRFPDLDERHLHNPSHMLGKPGLLWRGLWRILFESVAFDERHVRSIRDHGREADLVFVMHHHSLLDYLYFNYAFLKFGLPLVFFANNVATTLFRPLWRLILAGLSRLFGRRRRILEETDLLTYGVERGKPALLFLKRSGMWPWSTDQQANEYLETLIGVQQERIRACEGEESATPRPIRLMPQLLVWSQNPNRYRRSIRDMVFGNPSAPGATRKVLNFVINRGKAFVQMGHPVDLLEFLLEQPDDLSTSELARKLRFTALRTLQVEERVIKGPILKDAKRIRQEIVRTPEMQAEIRRMAMEEERSTQEVEKQIASYLKEMAADFSMAYIEGMCIGLTLVFERMYSEVIADVDGLERVREAGRNAPLVLLPCHRSHVDYLVISYLFYANGLIPPHIAAGINLSFFPIGHIFRRSGAFFIRRSFRENEAYRVAFREYIRKLLREGYWIEFFPEGGRSRTGKMLPPKYGMLRTVLDAVRSGSASDVNLVPVYVGYERVIEERAYTQELTGGEKKKENITGLLKTTKVLWSKYGRLYVSFGEPLSVRRQIEEAGVEDAAVDEPSYQDFVRRVGYRVVDGIQDIALVTPNALTAMALLTHPKRGVRRDVLLRRIGFLLAVASRKQAPLSKTLEHALKIRRQEVAAALEHVEEEGRSTHCLALGADSPVSEARGAAVEEAIDKVLHHYVEDTLVESREFEGEVVYTPVAEERIKLDFYKNNIVHLLVPEAILATALHATAEDGVTTEDDARLAARRLSRTFKYEFVFEPDSPFDERFGAIIGEFERAGLVTRETGGHGARFRLADDPAPQGVLDYLHNVLEPWLEAYWLLGVGLQELVAAEMPEKEFLKRLQRVAARRFHEGDVTRPEAASSVTFKHALDAYGELDYVVRKRRGRDRFVRRMGTESGEEDPLPELLERLQGFMRE
ncbi:MAG: 1-acyl-sn-glycerol-3-phosphate acyltransferase [Myxococcota bacterium]